MIGTGCPTCTTVAMVEFTLGGEAVTDVIPSVEAADSVLMESVLAAEGVLPGSTWGKVKRMGPTGRPSSVLTMMGWPGNGMDIADVDREGRPGSPALLTPGRGVFSVLGAAVFSTLA